MKCNEIEMRQIDSVRVFASMFLKCEDSRFGFNYQPLTSCLFAWMYVAYWLFISHHKALLDLTQVSHCELIMSKTSVGTHFEVHRLHLDTFGYSTCGFVFCYIGRGHIYSVRRGKPVKCSPSPTHIGTYCAMTTITFFKRPIKTLYCVLPQNQCFVCWRLLAL